MNELTATPLPHPPAWLKEGGGRKVISGVEPQKKQGWEEGGFSFVFFFIILLFC